MFVSGPAHAARSRFSNIQSNLMANSAAMHKRFDLVDFNNYDKLTTDELLALAQFDAELLERTIPGIVAYPWASDDKWVVRLYIKNPQSFDEERAPRAMSGADITKILYRERHVKYRIERGHADDVARILYSIGYGSKRPPVPRKQPGFYLAPVTEVERPALEALGTYRGVWNDWPWYRHPRSGRQDLADETYD